MPAQSLFLMNSEWIVERSRQAAQRLVEPSDLMTATASICCIAVPMLDFPVMRNETGPWRSSAADRRTAGCCDGKFDGIDWREPVDDFVSDLLLQCRVLDGEMKNQHTKGSPMTPIGLPTRRGWLRSTSSGLGLLALRGLLAEHESGCSGIGAGRSVGAEASAFSCAGLAGHLSMHEGRSVSDGDVRL